MTLQKEIVFSKNQLDILIKHARQNAPNESCAIIFGKHENDRLITREIVLTNNIEESPVRFAISSDELIKAYEHAERNDLDIIGIFHSHPDSAAYPSAMDRNYMEINPIPWIIFSNLTDEFKCYILESTIVPIVVTIN